MTYKKIQQKFWWFLLEIERVEGLADIFIIIILQKKYYQSFDDSY